jgi:nucleotide-binding universal stress UspA family protein
MSEPESGAHPSESEHERDAAPPGMVIGVDGSESSLAALRYGIALARRLGLRVQATAVWHHPSFLYGGYYPEVDWTPEDDAAKLLSMATDEVFGDDVPEWYSTRTRQGRPAEVLIEESKDADMIVVGSRGHGGFAGLLLGSVSAAVAEHAHCPVLVVHGK